MQVGPTVIQPLLDVIKPSYTKPLHLHKAQKPKSVDDRVAHYALDDGFSSRQNQPVTWRHLLHQTSEWEGELWDKPDLIDRHRQVGPNSDNSRKGTHRELKEPGSFWEYNDVRVNRLSLALLQVFKRPLADVLHERIMAPINASDSWQWHPYKNSWVEINGEQMPSVPGGAHWGGGLFISSDDHARVGWLVRNRGNWNGQQLISEAWINTMLAPYPLNEIYGCLWWLNTSGNLFANASDTSVAMFGAGYNLVWIDEPLDLVCVMRWINVEKVDELIGKIVAAL